MGLDLIGKLRRLFCIGLLALIGMFSTFHAQAEAVFSDGVSPLKASAAEWEQAQERFLEGKELFESQQYEAAMTEFAASRGIVASPNARLYRGRCLAKLGKTLEAYLEFGRAMVESMELSSLDARYRLTAESATTERAELADQIGQVALTVLNAEPETRVTVNGQPLRRTAWSEPIPVMPGATKVELVSSGTTPLVQEVVVTAGQVTELTLDAGAAPKVTNKTPQPTPPVREERQLSPVFWASAGVGALGVATFSVFGYLASQTHSELVKSCDNGCPDVNDQVERGRSQQLLANIGLGAAIVGAGAAVTLYLVDSPEPSDTKISLVFAPTKILLRGQL